MHRLLERQLRRRFGVDGVPPGLEAFLDDVERSYRDADEDRALLERSLDLTSQELLQRNAELAQELSETARVQAELSASERRHRLIVETASEGIWMLDAAGRTTFANGELARMLGVQPDQVLGRPLLGFVDEAHHPAVQALLAPGHRADDRRDLRFRRRDGSVLWGLVSATPILDEDGGHQGTLAMVMDITRRREAEQELELANRRLQELFDRRTQFINSTAHELATPLTPLILQMARLRRLVPDDPRAQQGFEVVERNLERLRALVSDILDAARLQSGHLPLHTIRTTVAVPVQAALDAYQPAAQQAAVRLHSEGGPAVLVDADPGRLGQILDNLLSNALKFAPAHSEVRVSWRRNGPVVEVLVEDEGPGVPPERRPLLFQPFSRVHDDAARIAGTGLGLYVSQGLAQRHGGDVRFEPRTPRGSRFVLLLPVAEAADRLLHPAPAWAPWGGAPRGGATGPDGATSATGRAR